MTKKTNEASAAPSDGVASADEWVRDRKVREELGDVSAMSLWRMDRDPKLAALGWPPAIRLTENGPKLRSRNLFEKFKSNMLAKALADRGKMEKEVTREIATKLSTSIQNEDVDDAGPEERGQAKLEQHRSGVISNTTEKTPRRKPRG